MIKGACHCGRVTYDFGRMPRSATACNCSICRRYGTLWAYGWDGEIVNVQGETKVYMHGDRDIEFHFCPECGVTTHWRGAAPDAEGRTRIAVNLRLADLAVVGDIPIRHFDGADRWDAVTGRADTVRDMWF